MLRYLMSVSVLTLLLATAVTATPAPTRAALNATPAPAPGLDGVVAVATGGCHGLALRADGTVWGWGCNSDWELGATAPDGGMSSATPIQATGLDQVRGLATGSDHGLALRADGSVWAWGKNDHGQVGVPQGENCLHHPRPCVKAPVPVPGLSGVKAVAASQDSNFALGADRTVWAWGDNGQGQLGTGSGADSLSPTRVEGLDDIISLSAANPRVVALRGDGSVWGWGGNDEQATPKQVPGLDDVAAVAAGDFHNLALKADGTVWTWGGPDNATPVAVAGLGPVTAIASSINLGGAVADGSVWIWEFVAIGSSAEPPAPLDDLSDVIAIAMGGESKLALKADGTVWTWGQYGTPRQVPAPAVTPAP